MNYISLILLGFAGARPRFCTANADDSKKSPALDLQKQLDAQAVEIAELKRQLARRDERPAPPEDATLSLLAKGAGVSLDDVRWRMQAGLDAEQAVQAAVTQKQSNATKEKN